MRTTCRPILRPRVLFALVPALAAFATSACTAPVTGDASAESSEDELRTGYDDLATVLSANDKEFDRWLAAKKALRQGFDRICGDTICSGDFSRLTTVLIQCSATPKARKLGECVWILGDSIDDVHPKTGKILSDTRVFACKVPVSSSAKAMLDTLTNAGDDALHAVLPGTQGSFYDALTTCFRGVVGNPPPSYGSGPFVELEENLQSDETASIAWWSTKRKLNEAFDDVCGDTFCEGEFQDVSGLRLSCAVDTSKNKVRSCRWSFARANTSIGVRGAITAETSTRSCAVSLDADPRKFVEALANDPLHTKLPGKRTSLYDALVGCL